MQNVWKQSHFTVFTNKFYKILFILNCLIIPFSQLIKTNLSRVSI